MSGSKSGFYERSIAQDGAWSDSPIDRSKLAINDDETALAKERMCEFMTSKNWHKMLDNTKRVQISELLFNRCYIELVKKYKDEQVSHSLIFTTISEFFDIKPVYLWQLLQTKYKVLIEQELLQCTRTKVLADKHDKGYVNDGFILPKL